MTNCRVRGRKPVGSELSLCNGNVRAYGSSLDLTDQCVPFYEARKERKGNGESKKVKNEGQKDDRLCSGHWKVRMNIRSDHICYNKSSTLRSVEAKLDSRLSAKPLKDSVVLE